MKSVGYEIQSYDGGQSFNQIPIPDDPPPFKPLSSYGIPFDNSQYALPLNPYSDYSAQASQKKPVAVHPKVYDVYHTMRIKLNKPKSKPKPKPKPTLRNFVTLPPLVYSTKELETARPVVYSTKGLPSVVDSSNGLEIIKSVGYEIKG